MAKHRAAILTIAGLVPVIVMLVIFATNFMTALDRSRQKRTMAGARDWAVALENAKHSRDLSLSGTTREIALRSSKTLPPDDGWGRPYRITVVGGVATIVSAGRDGIFERRPPGGATASFDRDIVWANDGFFQFPEGI